MTSHEELEMAIETCKEMIIMANPHSDRQKNLVKKLVQLRMKLQELKVWSQLCLLNVPNRMTQNAGITDHVLTSNCSCMSLICMVFADQYKSVLWLIPN